MECNLRDISADPRGRILHGMQAEGHDVRYVCQLQAQPHAHLYTEVAPVHVVAQEEVAGVVGRSSHLEQLHQVKELPVDVPAHWGGGRAHRRDGVNAQRAAVAAQGCPRAQRDGRGTSAAAQGSPAGGTPRLRLGSDL